MKRQKIDIKRIIKKTNNDSNKEILKSKIVVKKNDNIDFSKVKKI